MVTFPSAKINIGLQVLKKRNDGFHELNTLFYPAPFYDALEVIADASAGDIILDQTGAGLDVAPGENLVAKAYHLLRKDFPQIAGIHAHLHKTIPSGAGLGGGSSNAAFMLKLINEVFALNLSHSQLCSYALTLGSDCPFFIDNVPAIANGRGERLSPVALDLSMYNLVLVNPGIHINTAWAFSRLTKFSEATNLARNIQAAVQQWKHTIINDFEAPVFEAHPQILSVKNALYEAGALYASLSGTGSTVYGIFNGDLKPSFTFPSSYFIKWC